MLTGVFVHLVDCAYRKSRPGCESAGTVRRALANSKLHRANLGDLAITALKDTRERHCIHCASSVLMEPEGVATRFGRQCEDPKSGSIRTGCCRRSVPPRKRF
jgi:hypothetical protein